MRKITTLLLVGLAFLYAAEGFAQRGIGTNLPDRSSVLELKSGSRGLLIPRVELEDTEDPAPIARPANSLLVYNTTTTLEDTANPGDVVGEGLTGVRPGYYFWKSDNPDDDTVTTGQWIPLLNTAGNNIEIDENGVVSVKPGAIGQVLVTVEEDGEVFSNWVDASEILEDLLNIDGRNGITVVPEPDPITGITTFQVELGGTLIDETVITTNDEIFEIRTGTGTVDTDENFIGNNDGKEFFISNLNQIEVGENGKLYEDGGTEGADPTPTGDVFQETFDVLIVNKTDGLVQRVSVEDLLKNAIAVKNGMYYDPDDGFIKLGGDLTEKTEIKLQDGNDFIITRGETIDEVGVTNPGEFKVVGLEEVDAANKIMVVDENDVVRTVRRVISENISESTTVADIFPDSASDPENAYSPYVQEVNITVSDLVTATKDIELTLPEANAANEGQVINVSLTNINEPTTHTYALVIMDSDGTTPITLGALPYQSWVLKSNGLVWRVVSSN